MKKIMTFALSLLFFTACNAQTKTGSKSQSQPQQTMEQIALSDSTVIVDVRTPGEYAEGHIEKSINIPVDEISRESAQQQLKGYKTIITVCRSGGRSSRAKMLLEGAGFQNVLNGGGWQSFDAKMKNAAASKN